MRSLEIIKTRFWPVIHYNTMARAAPWSLKTQRQDFLGLELGLWLEEGWGWRRETQGSADSLSRRNPYGKKKKKSPGCFLAVSGLLVEYLLCVRACGTQW